MKSKSTIALGAALLCIPLSPPKAIACLGPGEYGPEAPDAAPCKEKQAEAAAPAATPPPPAAQSSPPSLASQPSPEEVARYMAMVGPSETQRFAAEQQRHFAAAAPPAETSPARSGRRATPASRSNGGFAPATAVPSAEQTAPIGSPAEASAEAVANTWHTLMRDSGTAIEKPASILANALPRGAGGAFAPASDPLSNPYNKAFDGSQTGSSPAAEITPRTVIACPLNACPDSD